MCNRPYLERISKQNITKVRQISVNDHQSTYVANITDSLIQASFLEEWRGYALISAGEIVGFGSYANYEKVPGAVKIYKMMIDKAHQGRGLGTQLLDLMIDEIQKNKRGAPIYIEVHADNSTAHHIYSKRFTTVEDGMMRII